MIVIATMQMAFYIKSFMKLLCCYPVYFRVTYLYILLYIFDNFLVIFKR